MKKIKIGFLPLYIKLYDDIGNGAKARPRLEPFYEKLACLMEAEGAEVVRNPFCRIKPEFEAAVKAFEAAQVDCIVTWHAAYSPSLECADALAGTSLPVIVLDTTETYDFSPSQDAGEISYCHGITALWICATCFQGAASPTRSPRDTSRIRMSSLGLSALPAPPSPRRLSPL